MTISESILCKADPETVFSYLVDLDNRKDYIPALDEIILLDPLPIGEGSRYTEVAVIGGRKLKTTYQVVAFEKNKLVAAKTIESVFPIFVKLSLKRTESGTILRIKLELVLKGIYKLASGIVGAIVSQQARGILKKVKGNVERIVG